MKKPLLGITLFAATAAAVVLYPAVNSKAVTGVTQVTPSVRQIVAAPPKIEVVFALDTTGSMSGLINAAKENIWSIATTMSQADPAPEISMGIVAYRDRGDAYVTRVIDLSSDLDSMYSQLMDLEAAGGGDGPESVNKALADAVQKISWSTDKNTYRVVFLVGDAPPHMDYANEMQYPEIVQMAKHRNIVINAIRCGQDETTRTTWQSIANLAQGEFFNVGQHGSAVAVATPFDESIAELSAALDDTRMAYGDAEVRKEHAARQEATEKVHAKASVTSRARRAAFNASGSGARNFLGDHDLLDAVAAGRVDVTTAAPESLPAPLRKMAPAARAAAVEEKAKKRAELKQKISKLAGERDAYIAAELEAKGGAKDSLDEKIYSTVKRQASEIGLSYDAPARY